MMKKITFLIGLVAITLSSFAQVGINTTSPDTSAVLHLKSSNKGLLIPTMTKTQREAMETNNSSIPLADGLLVYDTDYKRFYFWDISVTKWVVLNNWRKEYDSTINNSEHVTIVFDSEIGSNLGIGETSPSSKLTVNGNISVGNTNTSAPSDGAYVDGSVRIGSGAGNTAKLEVEGNTTTTGTANADEFVGRGITPVGGIIMYSGATDNTLFNGSGKGQPGSKMEGWAICNGTTYGSITTPDLRGRFIVGVGKSTDGATTYSLGNNSGEETHTLTMSEMPSHTHGGSTSTDGSHYHSVPIDNGGGTGGCNNNTMLWFDLDDDVTGEISGAAANSHGNTCDSGNHHHNFTTDNGTGGNAAHENRPPYYAVYYIMRIN